MSEPKEGSKPKIPRKPRGFSTGRANPGRDVKPGTLEGLEPTQYPSSKVRKKGKPVTREGQLKGLDLDPRATSGRVRNDGPARAKFMSEQLRIIELNLNHILRALTHPVLSKDGSPERYRSGTAKGFQKLVWNKAMPVDTERAIAGRYEGSGKKWVMQAGDLYTYAAKGSVQYSLQWADMNQVAGSKESLGIIYVRPGVLIDGCIVEIRTAERLAKDNNFPSFTVAHLARAQRIYPPEHSLAKNSATKKTTSRSKSRTKAPSSSDSSAHSKKLSGKRESKVEKVRKPLATSNSEKIKTTTKTGSVGKVEVRETDISIAAKRATEIRATDTKATGSKSTDYKGTSFRKPKTGRPTTKGKAVAGAAGAVEMLGGAFKWLGDRKQEAKVKRAYEKSRLNVDLITGSGRIATIQMITEVKTKEKYEEDGNPNDPLQEIFVCWYVQSFKDSAELTGRSDIIVKRTRSSVFKSKGHKEYNLCRQPRTGYELKYYDRETFYSSSADYSGLIIGVYRPFIISDVQSKIDVSEFMQRELSFSYDSFPILNKFILSAVVLPENEILHLKTGSVTSQGESLFPINLDDGRAVSFERHPRSLRNKEQKMQWNYNKEIFFEVVIYPENNSYYISSIFRYVPAKDTNTSAILIEKFKYKAHEITVVWKQQPYNIDPKIKQASKKTN